MMRKANENGCLQAPTTPRAELWQPTYHVCSEGDVLQLDVILQNLQPVPGDGAVRLGGTSPTHTDRYGILGFSLQVLHGTGCCSKSTTTTDV